MKKASHVPLFFQLLSLPSALLKGVFEQFAVFVAMALLRYFGHQAALAFASLVGPWIFGRSFVRRALENARIARADAPENTGKTYAARLFMEGAGRKLMLRESVTRRRALRHVLRIASRTVVRNPDRLLGALRSKPAVLALVHTGDYFVSIMMVACLLHGQGLHLVVPVFSRDSRLRQAVEKMELITGSRVECLGVDASSLRRIIRLARDPSVRIVVFFDLVAQVGDVRNGAVAPCTLFGRQAYLTDGAFRIAAKSGLPLIFMAGTITRQGYGLDVLPLAADASDPSLTFKRAVSLLEQRVRDDPASWHFLGSLEACFHVPALDVEARMEGQRKRLQEMIRRWT